MANGGAAERWREEAEFFDGLAAQRANAVAPLDRRVIERYRGGGRLFPKEYYFSVMGDLRGKSVLDVGCGEGADALLLAALGARVTAIDVSPKAIELGRNRARATGLDDSIDFVCSPLETARLRRGSFDIVCGDNVLHHMLPVLDETMKLLASWTKDDGRLVFMEPTNLNPTLRRIRFLVPVHTETTPGERPLEANDFRIISQHVGGLHLPGPADPVHPPEHGLRKRLVRKAPARRSPLRARLRAAQPAEGGDPRRHDGDSRDPRPRLRKTLPPAIRP
ncbi:MAG: class I SAM-dependent methyltransferase [Deltaproteobacteria bacterium]|nr:MAG: class I SAM-dependent methyltransferase [Deltaproteobacteria bacterium]